MQNELKAFPKLVGAMKHSIFLVLLLMPFYAFLTTWVGSNTGGLLALRAWKEVLLVGLLLGCCALIIKDTRLRKRILQDRLVWLIGLFSLWVLSSSVLLINDLDSTVLGVAIQLRPLLFFAVAATVSFYCRPSEKTLLRLVTLPAVGVVAFGLLQMFALPHDFLKHFGYQKNVTIPPFFTIDEQLDKIRIASTLRGPNPLGVYLVAPALILASKLKECLINFKPKTFLLFASYFLLICVVLYGSHSRSAWLGFATAALFYVWLSVSKQWKLLLLAAALTVAAIGGATIYQSRHTSFVRDIVLHDNPEEGGEVSSNQGHLEALKEGASDVKASPVWGCGAGCAGPASVHDSNGGRISENFFLQTAQEVGLVGLSLLAAVYVVVIRRLLFLGTNFSRAWLAVFVGVSIASMLSHAWADDTITYIWWGIAGLLLGFKEASTQKSRTKPRTKVT